MLLRTLSANHSTLSAATEKISKVKNTN